MAAEQKERLALVFGGAPMVWLGQEDRPASARRPVQVVRLPAREAQGGPHFGGAAQRRRVPPALSRHA